MEKRYKHMSLEERDRVAEMKTFGHTVTEIAEALGRSKSTLSRELRRNATPAYKVYLSHRAHEPCRNEEAGSRPRLKNEQVVTYVRKKLEQGLSPELIAGRIGLEHSSLSISHEAIHPKTEGRSELIGHLVRGHRKRKLKGIGRKERNTKIPNRISIEDRPISVENRSRFGHFEGDSLVSRKSLAALNSIVERKSRFLFLTRLERKTADLTKEVINNRPRKCLGYKTPLEVASAFVALPR